MINLIRFFKGLTIPVLMVFALAGPVADAAAPSVQMNESGDLKKLEARVLIDAPVNTVWQVITDYGNLKNVLPGYQKTAVIGGSGISKTLAIGLKPSGLAPAFQYNVRVSENRSTHTITIQRISGDFNSLAATYRLIPQGDKTLLVYQLNIDLGSHDKLGANHILKNSTEKSMAALDAYCARTYKRSLTAAK